jgi:DNA-binding NarL/FixJ family response regulator
MRTSIVIVSRHSLFADGLAAWLCQHLIAVELATIDPLEPDATEKIVAARPSAVLLDSTVPDVASYCDVEMLLRSLPGVKVVRLDPAVPLVQIMSSQQHAVGSVRDLADIILA